MSPIYIYLPDPYRQRKQHKQKLGKKKVWGRVLSTVAVMGEDAPLCPVYVANIKTFIFASSNTVVAGCKERMQAHHICPP